MRDQRLYIYKVRVDDGGAPCVDESLWSLAICKPAIRRTAQVGDVIYAFGTNGESPSNRLVCIAEVTETYSGQEYFKLSEFKHRGDCIYRVDGDGRFHIRDDAKFHSQGFAISRDLGEHPEYKNARVLISTNFCYFGSSGTGKWKSSFPHLKELVENLGQGHRVNHVPELHDELQILKRDVWQEFGSGCHGEPLHRPSGVEDDSTEGCYQVSRQECNFLKPAC